MIESKFEYWGLRWHPSMTKLKRIIIYNQGANLSMFQKSFLFYYFYSWGKSISTHSKTLCSKTQHTFMRKKNHVKYWLDQSNSHPIIPSIFHLVMCTVRVKICHVCDMWSFVVCDHSMRLPTHVTSQA